MSRPDLSVQLYTVREALAEDLPGALARLAEVGLRNVEVFQVDESASTVRAAADAAGLAIRSGHEYFLSEHVSSPTRSFAVAPLEKTLDAAAELGMEFLIDPFVPAERWRSRDEIARTADKLNQAAELASTRGIRVGYHNHSHEFHTSIDDVTAYELFAGMLDERVALEVDVFWAATGRQDVPALLTRLGERAQLLHLKDGFIGDDPFLVEDRTTVVLDQRAAGDGELPLSDILDAAPGAQLGVIEFDRFAGDLFDGIGRSAGWFHTVSAR